MPTRWSWWAAALALAAGAAWALEPLPWQRWADLRSLAMVDAPGNALLHASYCLDGCRYDRTSVEPGRGGPRFLRYEHTADGVEAVAFEDFGPGALTRIWMTMGFGVSQRLDPAIRLRIYVDGAVSPALDVLLPEFFEGAVAPFAPPLVYDRVLSSGGNVSYLPIPYRSGVRVALLHAAEARIWFQFNYTRLPLALTDAVTPFPEAADAGPLAQRLATTGRSLWSGAYDHNPALGVSSPPASAQSALLSSSQRTVRVHEATGPGWLDAVAVSVARQHWPALRVRVEVDGEVTVDVPLHEFFMLDPQSTVPTRSLLAGQDADGGLYAHWPMPHRRHLALSIFRVDDGSQQIALRYQTAGSREYPIGGSAPFRIAVRSACPTALPDNSLFRHEGSGRMVGLIAYKAGDGTLPGAYFLEGDERVYIDGSRQPLWYGTGTEDMFNGGFYYDQGPFALPLHGSPTRAGAGVDFASTAYRLFLTDAPAWRQAVDFRLESGALGNEPFCIRSVVYWYGHDQPSQHRVADLDLADAQSVHDLSHQLPSDAQCGNETGAFAGEPPLATTMRVCRFDHGSSRFTVELPAAVRDLRLRRSFDVAAESETGQAAEVWVNGVLAGHFGPSQRNPYRRWQQLDADLRLPAAARRLAIEIRPQGPGFSEARYELFVTPLTAAALARALARGMGEIRVPAGR